MNKVVLIGRLARDSELRYTAANKAMLRNTIAVDRRFKQEGQPTADFVPFVAFGKTAEFISNYFSKGARIALVGRIQTGSYDNAEGKKVYTTDVVVEEAEFVESKRTDPMDSVMTRPAGGVGMSAPESVPPVGGGASDGYFPIDDDGDIPF